MSTQSINIEGNDIAYTVLKSREQTCTSHELRKGRIPYSDFIPPYQGTGKKYTKEICGFISPKTEHILKYNKDLVRKIMFAFTGDIDKQARRLAIILAPDCPDSGARVISSLGLTLCA